MLGARLSSTGARLASGRRWPSAMGQQGAGGSRGAAAAAAAASSQDAGPSPPPPRYRPNVGICLFNAEGRVFAAQRLGASNGEWQMPQGGVDLGEDAADAALRELLEETSVSSARIVGRTDRWLTYDFPPEVRAKLHGGWAKYEGQAQLWFLLRFEGLDSEIDLEVEHQEFSAWRWVALEETPELVVAFKRGVYEQVVREFGPLISRHTRGGSG
jgi:putative (di)nucleoside polyphosphate hydrolase